MTLFERLQSIDRRLIYLATAIVVALPLLVEFNLPFPATPPAKSLFDRVDSIQPEAGKIVILSCDWGPDIQAECRPQTRAVMAHLMRKHIPFAIVSVLPEAPPLAEAIALELQEEFNEKYGEGYVRYGIDWCNWGYKGPNYDLFINSLMKNIPQMVPVDTRGTPIGEIPMMDGVEDHNDLYMEITLCGSAVYEIWVSFAYGQYRLPLAAGVTGVMAPTAFPYLDSGQLFGLLAGMKGAAEYEVLIERLDEGYSNMRSQSAAHLWILLLLIAGNIGFITAARRKKREESEGKG